MSEPPQTPSPNQLKESPPPDNRPIQVRKTTGSHLEDNVIKNREPERSRLYSWWSAPCVERSMLNGFVAGAGIGVIRSFSGGIFLGSIWGACTFALMASWSWGICSKENEKWANKTYGVTVVQSKKNQGGTTAATDRAS